MKPQIIKKDGKPEYAVIPYAEYRRLVDDAEMLADVRAFDTARREIAAGKEELIPALVVDRILDGVSPLKAWREFRGLTAAELARECGITTAAISQIETGKRKTSVNLLKKLGSVLKVDLDMLILSGDDPEKEKSTTEAL